MPVNLPSNLTDHFFDFHEFWAILKNTKQDKAIAKE
jgi:hypothetical protein